MFSLGVNLLFLFLIGCATVVDHNEASVRQKRFIGLFADSAKIITEGVRKQTDLLNQGIQIQKSIISQVPSVLRDATKQVHDTILFAAEYPATVAAGVVLQAANAFITVAKKQAADLPEINASVGIGNFVATGGKLRVLSTLESNGKVKLQRSGLSLLIDMPVKLGNLSVEYEKYSFSTWLLNVNGAVKATVGKNAFLVRLRMLTAPSCIVNLDRVEVLAIEDIKVDLTGTFSGFLKSAATYVATFLEGTIKAEVQKALDKQLSTFVNENCKLICANFAPLST